MKLERTLRLPSITINQLRANLTESGIRSAIELLERPGTDGLLVVENRNLLSPMKGRKSVIAFGSGFPHRPNVVAAVRDCDGKTEVPLAIVSSVRLSTEETAVAAIRDSVPTASK